MPSKLIKIAKNIFYLNPQISFPLERTNLPARYLSFKTHKEIYWEVNTLEFNQATKTLIIEVTNYEPIDYTGFNTQEVKGRVDTLSFKPLKWHFLEPLLGSYTKSRLGAVIKDSGHPYHRYGRKEENTEPVIDKAIISRLESTFRLDHRPTSPGPASPKKTSLAFDRHFKEVEFCDGYVETLFYVPFLQQLLKFKIINPYIRKEFNHIRHYFPKIFKGKKFSVHAEITTQYNEIIAITSHSPEIEKIDNSFIEEIKKIRSRDLLQFTPNPSDSKITYEVNELLSLIENKSVAENVFNESEVDIINSIFDVRKIRNKKQIQYLAGAKQSPKEKIRFTLEPKFGFLFLCEHGDKNYFCWELLNSHATYVWGFDKQIVNVPTQYETVETAINMIQSQGRIAYKKNIKHEINDHDFFTTIHHKSAGSGTLDGFVVWKNCLENIIGT